MQMCKMMSTIDKNGNHISASFVENFVYHSQFRKFRTINLNFSTYFQCQCNSPFFASTNQEITGALSPLRTPASVSRLYVYEVNVVIVVATLQQM